MFVMIRLMLLFGSAAKEVWAIIEARIRIGTIFGIEKFMTVKV
jgi:hypothetical protein